MIKKCQTYKAKYFNKILEASGSRRNGGEVIQYINGNEDGTTHPNELANVSPYTQTPRRFARANCSAANLLVIRVTYNGART